MTGTSPGPDSLPAEVGGQPVVSAFRHLPAPGQVHCTYTVILADLAQDTKDRLSLYTTGRAWWDYARQCWVLRLPEAYPVYSGLPWISAERVFARRVWGAAYGADDRGGAQS
jgi:hypothetical protein